MKIVYTYIVGDILHKGHLQYLKSARALGDKLIVGVLTDKAVMEKKSRPIIGFQERFDIVDGLESTNLVVAQNTYSPKKNLWSIRPDVLVESSSHSEEDIEHHRKIMELFKGRIVVLPYFPGSSSTKIKEKIRGKS